MQSASPSSFATSGISTMQQSLSRLNFSKNIEDALNIQIGTFLTCSYTYLSMSTYAARDTIALHGFSCMLREKAKERKSDAECLIKYVNNRGGTVHFRQIPAPETEWQSPTKIAEAIVSLEKDVKQSLWNLAKVSENENDHVTEDFVKGEFLEKQVIIVKLAADLLSNVRRVSEGPGLFILDRALLKEEPKKWLRLQRHSAMNLFYTADEPNETEQVLLKIIKKAFTQ